MKTFAGAAAEVSSAKPTLADAYKIVTEAAARTQ